MDDGAFDARIAATYDRASADRFAPEVLGPTVDLLAELAGGGPVLELAVGTGRVALPLADRGVEVHGLDRSEAMLGQLRAKPGAERIHVVQDDMATARLGRRFTLVYLVFNTISNLLTQAEQVACFRTASAHLVAGGRFLVEVGVPDLQRLPRGERFVPFEVTAGHVGIDEYDLVAQRLVSHHHWIDGERVRSFDSHHRYAWPAEYDLMAELAGLVPDARWADWHRAPFTAASPDHISVWQLPTSAAPEPGDHEPT